jgi:hypothetical protein
MLIEDLPENSATAYAVRFEPRRIADIHGDEKPRRDDDREFALVERASAFNNNLYDGFIRPWLRQWINEPAAEAIRRSHPFHQQQVMWSSMNPALWWLSASASQVSKDRQPAAPDNPLLAWQALFSNQIQDALDSYRDLRDATQELCFYGIYGVLNSLTGNAPGRNLQAHAEQHDKLVFERLQDALPVGGLMEALIRILFLLGRDSDEPGQQSVEKLIRKLQVPLQDKGAAPIDLRETLSLQKLLVATYPQESVQSLPLMLPEAVERQQVLAAVANLLPALLTGADHPVWRELHTLLNVPLPGFSAIQTSSEAKAQTRVVKQEPAVVTPEPIKPKASLATPQPVEKKAPEATLEPIKQKDPVVIAEPIKQKAVEVIPQPAEQKAPVVTQQPVEPKAPVATPEPIKQQVPVVATKPQPTKPTEPTVPSVLPKQAAKAVKPVRTSKKGVKKPPTK